jgi:hypothetical protein
MPWKASSEVEERLKFLVRVIEGEPMEVDDGSWLVSSMHYDLGYVGLEQKTLQPLDNPFGPRLSPMS